MPKQRTTINSWALEFYINYTRRTFIFTNTNRPSQASCKQQNRHMKLIHEKEKRIYYHPQFIFVNLAVNRHGGEIGYNQIKWMQTWNQIYYKLVMFSLFGLMKTWLIVVCFFHFVLWKYMNVDCGLWYKMVFFFGIDWSSLLSYAWIYWHDKRSQDK